MLERTTRGAEVQFVHSEAVVVVVCACVWGAVLGEQSARLYNHNSPACMRASPAGQSVTTMAKIDEARGSFTGNPYSGVCRLYVTSTFRGPTLEEWRHPSGQ